MLDQCMPLATISHNCAIRRQDLLMLQQQYGQVATEPPPKEISEDVGLAGGCHTLKI